MSRDASCNASPERLNSQSLSCEQWCGLAAWRFYGTLILYLVLCIVGQSAASVLSIYATESDSSLSARLHLPEVEQNTWPVIIIVPDAQQHDMRHERYIAHLLAGGFAVLVPQHHTVELGWLLSVAGQNPILDGGRIGLLSFGAGAALMPEIGRLPRALLYPGCGQLSFPRETAPLLLIHGDIDPINSPLACAALARGWEELGGGVTHYVLQGVGHEWDVPRPDSIARLLLQVPGRALRHAPRDNAAVTEQAADMVAQFFLELFR